MDPKFSPSPSLISGGGNAGDTSNVSTNSDGLWADGLEDVEKILEAEFPYSENEHNNTPNSNNTTSPTDNKILQSLNCIFNVVYFIPNIFPL